MEGLRLAFDTCTRLAFAQDGSCTLLQKPLFTIQHFAPGNHLKSAFLG